MKLLYFLLIITLFLIGITRCIILNFPYVTFYTGYDIYDYFKKRKWRNFNYYGIDMYIGMFGHGKTLSATHRARKIWKHFGQTTTATQSVLIVVCSSRFRNPKHHNNSCVGAASIYCSLLHELLYHGTAYRP